MEEQKNKRTEEQKKSAWSKVFLASSTDAKALGSWQKSTISTSQPFFHSFTLTLVCLDPFFEKISGESEPFSKDSIQGLSVSSSDRSQKILFLASATMEMCGHRHTTSNLDHKSKPYGNNSASYRLSQAKTSNKCRVYLALSPKCWGYLHLRSFANCTTHISPFH